MKWKPAPNWILLVILIASAALFATLLDARSLTWDDDSNIFINPYYRTGTWGAFWQAPYFGLYVPLTSTVWGILYAAGHGAAWPFRWLNLILHLTNICLVYLLLKGLAQRWKFRQTWPVYVGVALFAFHPLQVEAVAWISGGRDLLGATLALAALLFYFRDTGWKSKAIATGFFAASLLSKPNAVILPLVVVLIEYYLRPEVWRRARVWMALWLVIALGPIMLTMQAQADHIPEVEYWLRPWIMLDAYAFYLRKLLWPWPLSGNYARTPDVVVTHLRTLAVAIGFALGLFGALTWAWWRDRRFVLGLSWFLLLLPVSGVMVFAYQKISTVADHYHYLPMLAVAAVVMLLLEHARDWARAAQALSVAVLLALFAVSWIRVPVWRTDESFFTNMAEVAPKAYSTAIGMSIVTCQDQQDYDAGIRWTELALVERPNDILALANQAYCFIHSKNFLRAVDLEYYLNHMDLEEMERKQPTAYSSLLASVGTAEVELKEYEIGFQYLCAAYRIKPSEPNHARNLEIAKDILKDQGLITSCDPDFQIAPGEEEDMQDDPHPEEFQDQSI